MSALTYTSVRIDMYDIFIIAFMQVKGFPQPTKTEMLFEDLFVEEFKPQ